MAAFVAQLIRYDAWEGESLHDMYDKKGYYDGGPAQIEHPSYPPRAVAFKGPLTLLLPLLLLLLLPPLLLLLLLLLLPLLLLPLLLLPLLPLVAERITTSA